MAQSWEDWSEQHIEKTASRLGFARTDDIIEGVGKTLATMRKELGDDMKAGNDTVLDLIMQRLDQIEGRLAALEAAGGLPAVEPGQA